MDQLAPVAGLFCAGMAVLGMLRQAALASVLALGTMSGLIWLSGSGAPDPARDHLSGIGAGLVLIAGLVTPGISAIFFGLGAAIRRALTGTPDDDT